MCAYLFGREGREETYPPKIGVARRAGFLNLDAVDTPTLLQHFRTHDAPLVLSRGGELVWDDAELHRSARLSDPEGYALLALVPGVLPWQRARVLLCTLAASQDGLDERTRATLAKVTRALMFDLPPAYAVTALLALRRLRVNHKHATRAVVTFVLEHPEADALIEARRPALVDCFEHALGKATARGCARLIAEGDTGSGRLRRSLLRFTSDPAVAVGRVRALYAPGTYGAVAPQEPPARSTRSESVRRSSRRPTGATSPRRWSTSTGADRLPSCVPRWRATWPRRRAGCRAWPATWPWCSTRRARCGGTATGSGRSCRRRRR